MSLKKFDVHQKSRKKRIVITEPNGTVLQFDNQAEYDQYKTNKK